MNLTLTPPSACRASEPHLGARRLADASGRRRSCTAPHRTAPLHRLALPAAWRGPGLTGLGLACRAVTWRGVVVVVVVSTTRVLPDGGDASFLFLSWVEGVEKKEDESGGAAGWGGLWRRRRRRGSTGGLEDVDVEMGVALGLKGWGARGRARAGKGMPVRTWRYSAADVCSGHVDLVARLHARSEECELFGFGRGRGTAM